ncbi:hypothetical protein [Pseudomonas sp. TH15]|uniref:hypothetical protein n=1 Tax=Pseudomonas sp. TH15 TaxID=2796381 RepID=UPI0019126AE4|nr:hypothetical protein [Pseudomonas sp. TH15]MBK5510389.1 hypothetical protein [Pseudomonas sp. TH15]
MMGDPEKVESRGLSFSVTPDLKNGSFIFADQKIAVCGSACIANASTQVGVAAGCDLLIFAG